MLMKVSPPRRPATRQFFLFLNGVKKVQSCWESTFFGWHPKNANKWDNKSLSSCAAAQKISTWKHCASLRFRSTHSTVFPRDMLSFNLQWYDIQIFSLAYHKLDLQLSMALFLEPIHSIQAHTTIFSTKTHTYTYPFWNWLCYCMLR